jgi:hypothetical protein
MVEEKEKVIQGRRVVLIVSIAAIAIVLAGWWTYTYFERRWDDMLRASLAYTTTGIVRDKKKFVITKEEPYYINALGDMISERAGTEQWRIYFDIDNFDQVPEPKRTQLMNAETSRKKKYGMRFYPFYNQETEFYDRTQIGDKLGVHYKYVGDEKEIINVENLTHPRNNQPTSP